MALPLSPVKSLTQLFIEGWSDGRIRAYGPQSGRLQYEILDAHKTGVTALCLSYGNSPFKIVSGGLDGQIRVWTVTNTERVLTSTMKEHKGLREH
jgi:cilia- and flagella-associated protein 52